MRVLKFHIAGAREAEFLLFFGCAVVECGYRSI
jgi:hypothetical protein